MAEDTPGPSLAAQFEAAFNLRDLDALAALLAPEATAQVLGSELHVEEGPATIRDTSLRYLLREEEGSLQAEARQHEGGNYILIRRSQGERPLDCAVRMSAAGDRITRLEYLVVWFREAELKALGAGLGIPVCTSDPD
jgi:hypothetical protein